MAFVSQSPKKVDIVVSSGTLTNLGPGAYNSESSIGKLNPYQTFKKSPPFGATEERKLTNSKEGPLVTPGNKSIQ